MDRMFYNAMRCSGVGAVEAKTMYYYSFGLAGIGSLASSEPSLLESAAKRWRAPSRRSRAPLR